MDYNQILNAMVTKLGVLLIALAAAACSTGPSAEDRAEIARLTAVRDTLRAQLDSVRADTSVSPESLVGALHRMRITMLTLTDDMLRYRSEALASGASFEYVAQALPSNALRADSLYRELLAQRDSLNKAVSTTSEYNRESLVGAFALLEVQMRRLTVAMLEMTHLAARHGLVLPTSELDSVAATRLSR